MTQNYLVFIILIQKCSIAGVLKKITFNQKDYVVVKKIHASGLSNKVFTLRALCFHFYCHVVFEHTMQEAENNASVGANKNPKEELLVSFQISISRQPNFS